MEHKTQRDIKSVEYYSICNLYEKNIFNNVTHKCK